MEKWISKQQERWTNGPTNRWISNICPYVHTCLLSGRCPKTRPVHNKKKSNRQQHSQTPFRQMAINKFQTNSIKSMKPWVTISSRMIGQGHANPLPPPNTQLQLQHLPCVSIKKTHF